jgi:predicted metal-dependent hydrolase
VAPQAHGFFYRDSSEGGILAHELVHLYEPRHNTRFWTALERVMPDVAERKQWLAEHSGRF